MTNKTETEDEDDADALILQANALSIDRPE